jgi:hypothetical protein
MLPSAFASDVGAVSRLGPMVPVAFAGANVWHEAQAFAVKTAFPAAALPPPPEDVVVADVVVAAEVVVAADVVGGVEVVPIETVTVDEDFPSEV